MIEIWTIVFGLFGAQWVMLQGVLDMLASWQGWFGDFVCHQNILINKV